jgi:hypothetical protein
LPLHDAIEHLAVGDVREVDVDVDPKAGFGCEDLRPPLIAAGAHVPGDRREADGERARQLRDRRLTDDESLDDARRVGSASAPKSRSRSSLVHFGITFNCL